MNPETLAWIGLVAVLLISVAAAVFVWALAALAVGDVPPFGQWDEDD